MYSLQKKKKKMQHNTKHLTFNCIPCCFFRESTNEFQTLYFICFRLRYNSGTVGLENLNLLYFYVLCVVIVTWL